MKHIPTEALLVVGAVLMAAGGLGLQLGFGWDAFPRAGALMVAFGVALAGREIFRAERAIAERESRVERLEAAYLDHVRKDTETDAEDDAEDEDADDGKRAATFTRLAENLREFREARLRRLGTLINTEIAIVCVGTLIWGFGDLVG